jgi:hypothetical protein
VEKLIDDLLFDYHTLHTDSYYSSIPLAQSLLQKQMCFYGTMQQNRKFMLGETKKKQNHSKFMTVENSYGIKFVKWTGKRTVSVLTTCKNHKYVLIKGNPGKKKPDLVFDYNNEKKALIYQMKCYVIITA